MGLLSRFSDAWSALTGQDAVKVALRPNAEAPQPRNRTRAVARAGNGGLEKRKAPRGGGLGTLDFESGFGHLIKRNPMRGVLAFL